MKQLKGKKVSCILCGKSFYEYPSEKRKFCSHKCYWAYKIGKVGVGMLGKHHTKHSNEKNRLAHLGKNLGDKSSNWKGGIYPKIMLLRRSERYKLWTKNILIRDDYTCMMCFKRGVYLETHHIIPFAICYNNENLDLIFDENNGITLCKNCHRLIHKKLISAQHDTFVTYH